jgi:hypothetical protein
MLVILVSELAVVIIYRLWDVRPWIRLEDNMRSGGEEGEERNDKCN